MKKKGKVSSGDTKGYRPRGVLLKVTLQLKQTEGKRKALPTKISIDRRRLDHSAVQLKLQLIE